MNLLLIILIPLVAALISAIARKRLSVLYGTAFAASVLELVNVFYIYALVSKNGSYALGGYFVIDALGMILLLVITVLGFATTWYSTGYLKAEVEKGIIGLSRVQQYFALLHLFIGTMSLAIITASPLLMWIAIEATTLSTAFLISFYNKPSAIEAAWKYLLINSVGLLLAFLGTLLFLSSSSGTAGLATWHTLMENASGMNPFLIKMAFVFVLLGYGTKVGLAPMHTWLPDAHGKAPAPISGLLSGVLLNVAFFAVLRFKAVADTAIGPFFSQELLILLGVFSMLIAAFIIFVQKNYKRLLAYSSVEHMGIIALGFGFGGVAAFAALLHLVYHSLTKCILFLSSGNIFLKYSSTKMVKVRGMLSVLPVTSSIFLVGFLSVTGVPPFGIFLTEISILAAGLSAYPAIAILALLAIVLVFVGFLKHTMAMVFGEPDGDIRAGESTLMTTLPIVFLAVILVIMSVFVPDSLRALLQAATATY